MEILKSKFWPQALGLLVLTSLLILFSHPSPRSLTLGFVWLLLGILLRLPLKNRGNKGIHDCYHGLRYPLYLSHLFIVLAIGFASNQAVILCSLLLLTSFWIRRQIRAEELLRRQIWGPEYAEFAYEVSAVFPQFWFLRRTSELRSSGQGTPKDAQAQVSGDLLLAHGGLFRANHEEAQSKTNGIKPFITKNRFSFSLMTLKHDVWFFGGLAFLSLVLILLTLFKT